MKKHLNDKTIAILEEHGFHIESLNEQDGEFYAELEQYTPAGEDWIVTIWFSGTDSSFADAFAEYASDFDVDEAVEIWIPNRGKNGVPASVSTLLEDAEWKQDTLEECAIALNK